MPGLVLVPWRLGIGTAISDLEVAILCTNESEWEGTILFVPL